MPRLLLFDIDGTLLTTDRAGLVALELAFSEILGIADALAGISLAGNTDSAVTLEVCRRAGRQPPSFAEATALRECYLHHLDRRLAPGQGRLMPGVAVLVAELERLAARGEVLLGLVTGNFRVGAYRKLAAYGLERAFPFGGFGCDHPERSELVGLALRRAAVHQRQTTVDFRSSGGDVGGCPRAVPPAAAAPTPAAGESPLSDRFDPRNTVLVGDTPRDVVSTKPWGVTSLAVATGPYTCDELRAAGADRVLPDLADLSAALAALLR